VCISDLSEPKRFAAFPAMLLAISYVLLCGAESSTVRALIAAACVAVQVLDEHAPRFSQRCFVALFLLMLISPWCFFDLGVQLTFAALAGIGLGSRLSTSRRGLQSLWWVSVSVWLLTSVVGVVWTGRLSLVAVVFNLVLAAPWSALDCTFGLLAVAVCTIGLDSNGYLLQAVVLINQKALEFVSWGAAVPHATVEFESVPLRCAVAAILMCLLALLACRAMRRSGAWYVVRGSRSLDREL
jgi:ComEC/Rec2-related protein